MPEWLSAAFKADADFKPDVLIIRLSVAFLLGIAVAAVYCLTYRSPEPLSHSFLSTLVLLCLLIAIVTQVIGENTARAFSLVGALAIIRFRTVVQDTRDTAFVIFAVVIGMAVGAGFLQLSLIGFGVTALAAFVVRPGPVATNANSPDWTLMVRLGVGSAPDEKLSAIFRQHLDDVCLMATATGRQGAALDLTYRVRFRSGSTPTALVGELNHIEGVHNVELRRQ